VTCQTTSRFSVCKPTLNIQSPHSFAPIIEAGVTSTQSSWRVTLTPLPHPNTPCTPKPKPLSLTQIWSISIVFCSNGSCSSRGETTSCGRKGKYIIFVRRPRWLAEERSPPTRGTQAWRYIHLNNPRKIPINLITGPQKISWKYKVQRFLQFQLRKAFNGRGPLWSRALISLSPGLYVRMKLFCLPSFVPVTSINWMSGSARS
jgi:hypothetical protein